MEFNTLGLSENILKALDEAGYKETTPVQEQTIPKALKGQDILGIAQTGTGKTAAFCLPILEKISKGRTRARMPRSLILEPTRELAAQVADSCKKYGKYHKLSIALLIGGTAFLEQEKKLDQGVDILIATPGRLLDHFKRGKLLLSNVEILVVDEADRMLDMGFIPDIEQIFKLTNPQRQTLFFSATMPSAIEKLTSQFLRNPSRIEIAKPATTAENVDQSCLEIFTNTPKEKRMALRHLIDSQKVQNGIIFCNRKKDVDIVYRSLLKHGYSTAAIHGDLQQGERMETLDLFRAGKITFLVASDVAARGLDIPKVSHVFNYDPPVNADDYVHRIGRTGRAGRDGTACTLLTRADIKIWKSIEKLIGTNIRKLDNAALKEKMEILPKRKAPENRQQVSSKGEPPKKIKIIGFGDHIPSFILENKSLVQEQ